MSYVGHVHNGKIEFDVAIPLADGTKVLVEAVAESTCAEEIASSRQPQTLLERYKAFVGIVDDLPVDMADQHDHYLYGTPKK